MAKQIKVAIAYDFDGTLAPGNMQEWGFIPELGVKKSDFWEENSRLANEKEADEILTYMRLMLKQANAKDIKIDRNKFVRLGESIPLFDGVHGWFDYINQIGVMHGCEIEHFILSSGLREIIEGTSIAKYFKKIYASGFLYDQHDVAVWPAQSVNFTTKTQYLFRINKGALDVNDKSNVNKYIKEDERPIPFDRIIYIGDGETDVPCMRLVKEKGGHAIAVYPPSESEARSKVSGLLKDGRVNCIVPAKYGPESELSKIVSLIIKKIKIDVELTQIMR